MSISQEKFKEMLKEKGLKVTNQRLLVLQVLAEHGDEHMTAEDIFELVKEDYPEIGLATIYRTVQLLLDMQLVDRIMLDDGCVRYEIGDFWMNRRDIVTTIIMKLLLFPLAIHQQKSTAKMSVFQPLINEIQQKYKKRPSETAGGADEAPAGAWL